MSVAEAQLEELRREFPDATVELRQDGLTLVTVPNLALPPGWNQSRTTVQFIAPVGYPMAQPDCFWADDTLRLASGGTPKNSALQAPPFGGPQRVWFSWHVAGWNGSRDTLRSYLRVILNRLARPE